MRQIRQQPNITGKPTSGTGTFTTIIQPQFGFSYYNISVNLLKSSERDANGGTVTAAQLQTALDSITEIRVIINTKTVMKFSSADDLLAYMQEQGNFNNTFTDATAFQKGTLPFYFETPRFKIRGTQEISAVYYGGITEYTDPITKVVKAIPVLEDFKIEIDFTNPGIALTNMNANAQVTAQPLPPALLRRRKFTQTLQNAVGENEFLITAMGSLDKPLLVKQIEFDLPWRASDDPTATSTLDLESITITSGDLTIIESSFEDLVQRRMVYFYSDKVTGTERLVVDFTDHCWGGAGDYLPVTPNNQLRVNLNLNAAHVNCNYYITDLLVNGASDL